MGEQVWLQIMSQSSARLSSAGMPLLVTPVAVRPPVVLQPWTRSSIRHEKHKGSPELDKEKMGALFDRD